MLCLQDKDKKKSVYNWKIHFYIEFQYTDIEIITISLNNLKIFYRFVIIREIFSTKCFRPIYVQVSYLHKKINSHT
jgi:hypothetical protein